MSASLVGSEMCIRDRICWRRCFTRSRSPSAPARIWDRCIAGRPEAHSAPVSYTHLTLPTICSV
eukprot:9046669-Alexandrium_andersonii.AAC.1